MKRFRGLGIIIFMAVFAVATAIVMLLWNSVAVNVFPVGELTFWYAAGLLILSKLLLGGWHHGHSHFHKHHRKGFRNNGDKGFHMHKVWEECCDSKDMKDMHEKFHSMSARERQEHIRRHMAFAFDGEGGDGKWHGGPGEDGKDTEPETGAGSNG